MRTQFIMGGQTVRMNNVLATTPNFIRAISKTLKLFDSNSSATP